MKSDPACIRASRYASELLWRAQQSLQQLDQPGAASAEEAIALLWASLRLELPHAPRFHRGWLNWLASATRTDTAAAVGNASEAALAAPGKRLSPCSTRALVDLSWCLGVLQVGPNPHLKCRLGSV